MWIAIVTSLLAWSVAMILVGVYIGHSDFEFYARELKEESERRMKMIQSYEELMRKRGEN